MELMGHRLGRSLFAILIVFAVGNIAQSADVNLAEIVGGGDGTGNPAADPANIGISADDGTFQQAHQNNNIPNSGDNPQVVDDAVSPFIQAVFIMDTPSLDVTGTGIIYDFPAGDQNGGTWNHILINNTHDIDKGLGDFFMGGVTYSGGIGIHSSAGIAFDLDAIRAAQPTATLNYFSAFIGIDRCAGNIRNHVLLFSDGELLDSFSAVGTGNQAQPVQMFVPEEAKFLVLATGANGDGNGCDHGAFAEAKLSKAPKVVLTRELPNAYTGGQAIDVSINVDVIEPTTELEVREVAPVGFVPSAPNNGGTIEQNSPSPGRHTIVWKFMGGVTSRNLTYTLTLPNPYPNSSFVKSTATADGEVIFILGDRGFIGGPLVNVIEALFVTLANPWGNSPGFANLRRDLLTDGDAESELTIAPAAGDSIAPDFNGASASSGPGNASATALIWTRIAAGAGWFELNTCDNCMSYLAFYVEFDNVGQGRHWIRQRRQRAHPRRRGRAMDPQHRPWRGNGQSAGPLAHFRPGRGQAPGLAEGL